MAWMGVTTAVGVGVALCGLGFVAFKGTLFNPPPLREEPLACPSDAPLLPRGKRIRVLVWNIQYGAGRDKHFFYDGGPDVHADEHEVRATLEAMSSAIERLNPDIVLLQEVDRGSERTQNLDQHEDLLSRLSYPCHTTTPYHQAPYVPHPPQKHLGQVNMHLAVWSRYKLQSSRRVDLPRLKESWIRQQLNLKRAIQEVDLPVEGGGLLTLLNSHFSAFSHNDGTVERQVAVLRERIDKAQQSGSAWVVGADLNSLPPQDDPARLPEGPSMYPVPSPITGLFNDFPAAIPAAEHLANPQPWRTYLPPGSNTADRSIDHIFHGRQIEAHATSVVADLHTLSDHLPLLFDFELR